MKTRFHLAWRDKHDFSWHEKTYATPPKHIHDWCAQQPCRLEDLMTGAILHSSFDLRHETFFATHPERFVQLARGRRAWQRLDRQNLAALPLALPEPLPTPAQLAAARALVRAEQQRQRLTQLQRREKDWTRKFKLAATKLKKLRRALRRLATRNSELGTDL